MKKSVGFILLFLSGITSLVAQQNIPEMGLALRYKNNVDGLYATHRTYPFGTVIEVTNMLNNFSLEVQVGGRPDASSWALVEISPQACDMLGIGSDVLTQVYITAVSKPAQAPAMRRRVEVEQTGIALALTTGDDLTASHPSIAINTSATMINTTNGKSITIVITGRVPASKDRIVEISRAAAQALGIKGSGEVHLKTQ